ncbi:MAG TPA: DNA primase [Dehalococcoidia bacterium]|nr:DNA primase [Dehalococcoidia bacterium]
MTVVDEVKQRLDIVQIVSEYVKLRKSGRNYKALCPFHSEKDPSFFVFPERQSWHCFGACGTGGDVFSFIMKKEGMDFGEALRHLASKTGVDLTATARGQARGAEKERLFELNEIAAEYYHYLLLKSSEGEIARNYLDQRQLSSQTIKNFQLGYSPAGWETIKQYLKVKGYKETEIIAAGLLVERDDGGSYDRFRNRLMFPIRNVQGRVQGFGARVLDDSSPKYINSPQTLVFDKSSTLYGIDRARTAIRQKDQAIIVEGYLDTLMAHQQGWEHTVASMGTSMTDRQLAIIKGLTKNVILALDADTAGEEAISRSGEMVDRILPVPPTFYGWVKYEDAYNAEVKILLLPQGKDPDDVIRENASKWQELIQSAKPMIDFIFETVTNRIDLTSVREKSAATERLIPLLAGMKDPLRQAHYVERLSRLLNVDQRVLADTLRKCRIAAKKRRPEGQYQVPALPIPSSSPLEHFCLALLLQYPELKAEITGISPEHFEHSENREIFSKWCQSEDITTLKQSLDSALHEYLESLLKQNFLPIVRENETARRDTLNDCIIRLQENRLKHLEAKRQELLALEAETGGIEAQLAKLEEQGIEISKQLKELFIKQSHRRRWLARRDVQ